MHHSSISSKNHFSAYQEIVSDYKLLLVCELDLSNYIGKEEHVTSVRLKKEMILLLQRIIKNKNILLESTKEDEDYLQKLIS